MALPRFILAMRHNLNVLDSSIRFGTKLKWSRIDKYCRRGLVVALPLHIRLHGHGGLGAHLQEAIAPGLTWMRGQPMALRELHNGSTEQLLYILSMAKLLIPMAPNQTFQWNARWTAGYAQIKTELILTCSLRLRTLYKERIPLCNPRELFDALNSPPPTSSKSAQLFDEVIDRWQTLHLENDLFHGEVQFYNALPVTPRMNAEKVKR